MDQYVRTQADPEEAVQFTGSWREYLPIAASNVLLTIVTLGIYRFWAAARQRRYLWSRTELIGEPLEWTGSGKEMFIGFLMVMAVLLPFFLFFQFLLPALAARGLAMIGGLVMMLFYVAILYLGGFARFRALRYRLSRSWWRGIRGGSDNPGWDYGGEYLGRTILSGITWGLAWPWQAAHLWNSLWNQMSFGQQQFATDMNADGLKARWFAIYWLPIVGLLIVGIIGAIVGVGLSSLDNPASSATLGAIIIALFVAVYLLIPLAMLNWYAAFYRKAADEMRLGDLAFGFDATTWEWLKLWVGNIALAIVTLGLGISYWGYRNWSFIVRHLHLYGQVDVSMLTQSTTHAPREAEGFADAFDIGAI